MTMTLEDLTPEVFDKEYYENGQSTTQIAKKYGTNSTRVFRLAKKWNKPLRSNSESQKLTLAQGVKSHPTKGKRLSLPTRVKISEAIADSYWTAPPEKREQHRLRAKKHWETRPKELKDDMREKTQKAVLVASKKGSKLEHFFCHMLRESGIEPYFHEKGMIVNEDMEVDIYIPELKCAIEVDGPTHFFPIYGEEQLAKRQAADQQKTGLLIEKGVNVIRIRNNAKAFTRAYRTRMWTKLKNVLDTLPMSLSEGVARLVIIGDRGGGTKRSISQGGPDSSSPGGATWVDERAGQRPEGQN